MSSFLDQFKELTQRGQVINECLRRIRIENYAHLEEYIPIESAAQKYGVPASTIRGWIRNGYLSHTGKRPTRVSEAEMAYLADIYRIHRLIDSRAPLVDRDGRPKLLKDPTLAILRRLQKAAHNQQEVAALIEILDRLEAMCKEMSSEVRFKA